MHSFTVPADLVAEAHRRGAKVICQVQTVAMAREALDAGADVLIAQGYDGGGHVGSIGTLSMVPAIVDVAGDVPVLAAGGIADGRGLAAALMLGAQGASLGTRFYASGEATVAPFIHERLVERQHGRHGLDAELRHRPQRRLRPDRGRPRRAQRLHRRLARSAGRGQGSRPPDWPPRSTPPTGPATPRSPRSGPAPPSGWSATSSRPAPSCAASARRRRRSSRPGPRCWHNALGGRQTKTPRPAWPGRLVQV